MSGFLVWLESTGLAAWTRESPSLWAYPTILTLHTVGLSIVVGASAVVDLRLLGAAPRILVGALSPLFAFIWIGFVVNAGSGVLLFIADATNKAGQTVFYIKLACIAAALIVTSMTRSVVAADALPQLGSGGAASEGPRARTLAGLSLLLWAAAITAGRLMAYL